MSLLYYPHYIHFAVCLEGALVGWMGFTAMFYVVTEYFDPNMPKAHFARQAWCECPSLARILAKIIP